MADIFGAEYKSNPTRACTYLTKYRVTFIFGQGRTVQSLLFGKMRSYLRPKHRFLLKNIFEPEAYKTRQENHRGTVNEVPASDRTVCWESELLRGQDQGGARVFFCVQCHIFHKISRTFPHVLA